MEAHPYAEVARRAAERNKQYEHLPEKAQALTSVMVAESEFLSADGKERSGWRYLTYQDLLLDLGEPKVARLELPPWVDEGEPRQCYQNSFNLAADCPELTYVEGYALGAYFPVAHAWLEDESGRIIDPTWVALEKEFRDRDETEAAYLGVRFDRDFLLRHVHEVGWYSVFASDWMQRAQILQHGFVLGENNEVIGIGRQ